MDFVTLNEFIQTNKKIYNICKDIIPINFFQNLKPEKIYYFSKVKNLNNYEFMIYVAIYKENDILLVILTIHVIYERKILAFFHR